MLCSLLAWSLNQCLCVVRESSCWCNSGKGVLLVADTAAETPAVDLGYADVLSLRRRLERRQCTCEAGETSCSGCQPDG